MQHYSHIAHLLQPHPVSEEMALDVQDDTYEIKFIIDFAHTSAQALKTDVCHRVIQEFPITVKFNIQIVLIQ